MSIKIKVILPVKFTDKHVEDMFRNRLNKVINPVAVSYLELLIRNKLSQSRLSYMKPLNIQV